MSKHLWGKHDRQTLDRIKEELKDAADPVVVARAIDMDIEDPSVMSLDQRRRVSVLCPGHEDNHHGSCFLMKGGCKCFVCNKTYDVFDMVRLHLGVSFEDAVGMVADICGGRERFFSVSSASGQWQPRVLGNNDLKLLGLYNKPIYVVRSIVPAWAEPPLQKGFRHEWFPGDPKTDEEDYVVIEECVCKSPLQELCAVDPEEYRRLIRDKAGEALEEYREEQKRLFAFSHSRSRAMNKEIRRLEEIYIEHDGSLKELYAQAHPE